MSVCGAMKIGTPPFQNGWIRAWAFKEKHIEAEFSRPKNGNVIVNGIEYCFPMEIKF